MKLGVNIDHTATLRNARGVGQPDIAFTARTALSMGADYIVIHLRGDERHIKEADLALLTALFPGKIHLECAANKKMEKLALKYKPYGVCIVPEGPGELTTQGGLKFTPAAQKTIAAMTKNLKKAGIKVSLFIDPKAHDLRIARRLGADIVELCTKDYAEATERTKRYECLEELAVSSILAKELDLEVHSGHGLDYKNVRPIACLDAMECLNIGFSIIARALYVGLPTAIMEMKEKIDIH